MEVKTGTVVDTYRCPKIPGWSLDNNALLIHAHQREDFAMSPKANNWKSLWRDHHFPWGWTRAGGRLVVDEPYA